MTELTLRPLADLVRNLDAVDEDLRRAPRPLHVAVVGGGASGCELALAIHQRLGGHAGFRLTLLQGHDRLLPEFPARVGRHFAEAFRQRGVAFRLNARVTGVGAASLVLAGGETVAVDAVLWATQAAPPRLLADSGLAVTGGFLRVTDTLQSVSDPAVFGTGDCVTFDAYPGLPKNGVHAVREGAVLFDNMAAFLRERPLRRFHPQRFCLCLLNTADGRAVLRYGPLTWKSRWARRLKDRIDRAWMMKFTRFAPMAAPAAGQPEAP